MVTQLSIVKIDGKHYFVDERLKEYRETTNPHSKIAFDELEGRKVEDVEPIKTLKQKIKRRLR